jgi:hypothetical protein
MDTTGPATAATMVVEALLPLSWHKTTLIITANRILLMWPNERNRSFWARIVRSGSAWNLAK